MLHQDAQIDRPVAASEEDDVKNDAKQASQNENEFAVEKDIHQLEGIADRAIVPQYCCIRAQTKTSELLHDPRQQ